MYLGVVALLIAVAAIAITAFLGIGKFQKLTKDVRNRSGELPLAVDLNQKVSELRALLWEEEDAFQDPIGYPTSSIRTFEIPSNFNEKRLAVEEALEKYHQQLLDSDVTNQSIAENSRELEFVENFRQSLMRIKQNHSQGERVITSGRFRLLNTLREDLEELEFEAAQLPAFMQERMESFAENARSQYHHAYFWCVIGTVAAVSILSGLMVWFRVRIFRPLETLLNGSRQIAAGNHAHRIKLQSDDELSELADALDDMTQSFLKIQQDLNEKVRQRTQEVIRSEKMASVGFLAAGIAHEINNPLATIAWSAEALESRFQDVLDTIQNSLPDGEDDDDSEQHNGDIQQIQKYIGMVLSEAYRCKEITARMLDFARMGDAKKTSCNLGDVVQSVIEMIKPMSTYRDRNLFYAPGETIYLPANAQELKQVVLNLVTNALGSVDSGGTVEVELTREREHAVIRVTDDGCGMTAETKKQLFEPFFTRRRDGQGTGLGLSITYQIVQEHGGEIVPFSDGPGKGATFVVRLPMIKQNEQKHASKTAA